MTRSEGGWGGSRGVRALLGVAAGLACCALLAAPVLGYRQGPLGDRVGACGFGPSCWDIGCHQSYPIDTTQLPWSLEQRTGPLPPGWVPGRTYDLRLAIDERASPFGAVYGFELSPMASCPFSVAAGDIVPLDPARTRRFEEAGLVYLSHQCTCANEDPSCCGFRPQSEANLIDWPFLWIAPPSGTGDVTFYMGFNAANWDGTPDNDRITLGSVTLPQDATCPPPVTDLRVTREACDPAAPGEERLRLGWSRTGASFRVRRATDVASAPADRAQWTDAGTLDCLAPGAEPLVFLSVAEDCGSGQEGEH